MVVTTILVVSPSDPGPGSSAGIPIVYGEDISGVRMFRANR